MYPNPTGGAPQAPPNVAAPGQPNVNIPTATSFPVGNPAGGGGYAPAPGSGPELSNRPAGPSAIDARLDAFNPNVIPANLAPRQDSAPVGPQSNPAPQPGAPQYPQAPQPLQPQAPSPYTPQPQQGPRVPDVARPQPQPTGPVPTFRMPGEQLPGPAAPAPQAPAPGAPPQPVWDGRQWTIPAREPMTQQSAPPPKPEPVWDATNRQWTLPAQPAAPPPEPVSLQPGQMVDVPGIGMVPAEKVAEAMGWLPVVDQAIRPVASDPAAFRAAWTAEQQKTVAATWEGYQSAEQQLIQGLIDSGDITEEAGRVLMERTGVVYDAAQAQWELEQAKQQLEAYRATAHSSVATTILARAQAEFPDLDPESTRMKGEAALARGEDPTRAIWDEANRTHNRYQTSRMAAHNDAALYHAVSNAQPQVIQPGNGGVPQQTSMLPTSIHDPATPLFMQQVEEQLRQRARNGEVVFG